MIVQFLSVSSTYLIFENGSLVIIGKQIIPL